MTPGAAPLSFEMASVLFIDIVGYSLETIDWQSEHLTALQECVRRSPEAARALSDDELITVPAGDGVALVFLGDPLAAVRCALEIARTVSTTPELRIRMGIHMGPVRRHGDIREQINVVGGGINIAQRVMDLGDAGHILVSGSIADILFQLADWRDHVHDLGLHEVKHGLRVQICSVCCDGFGSEHPLKNTQRRASASGDRPTAGSIQPSVAVLPFVDMSREGDHRWFSDGLTEEIINALAHIPGLKVIARTSVYSFRDKGMDVREIARALDVTTVLEGSVRRAGNDLRMTAQLISANDGSHLWSERYDRKMTDIFGIQDDVAASIAEALRVRLSNEPAVATHKPSLPAYDALLKARHYLWQASPESLKKAREYYETAVAIDPAYARAYLELGAYYGQIATLGISPAHKAVPLARAAIQKSLDLDPVERPETHAASAVWIGVYDYDWARAARLFNLARSFEPLPPAVRFSYASSFLISMRRYGEAVLELRLALEQDPLSTWWRVVLAIALFSSGRAEEALSELGRVLELDRECHHAYFYMSGIQAARGHYGEAMSCADRAHALAPQAPLNIGLWAGFLQRMGNRRESQALVEQLRDSSACQVSLARCIYHLVCGEFDEAADWAREAIGQREPTIVGWLQSPSAEGLRKSSRWPPLSAMINLPCGSHGELPSNHS
jgi:adenylate cyclase